MNDVNVITEIIKSIPFFDEIVLFFVNLPFGGFEPVPARESNLLNEMTILLFAVAVTAYSDKVHELLLPQKAKWTVFFEVTIDIIVAAVATVAMIAFFMAIDSQDIATVGDILKKALLILSVVSLLLLCIRKRFFPVAVAFFVLSLVFMFVKMALIYFMVFAVEQFFVGSFSGFFSDSAENVFDDSVFSVLAVFFALIVIKIFEKFIRIERKKTQESHVPYKSPESKPPPPNPFVEKKR